MSEAYMRVADFLVAGLIAVALTLFVYLLRKHWRDGK